MKIVYKEIPKEFLKTLPDGMKFVSKSRHDFLVIEKIYCRNEHNLVDNTIRIHGESSIKLNVQTGVCEGIIFLDAFWGSHAKLYSFIPRSSTMKILEAFCPVCGVELTVDNKCTQKKCNSHRSIEMILPDKKSKILSCARLECWDIV